MPSSPVFLLGREVCRIGLGCLRLSPDREAESFAVLDAYVARGGNVFDSAEIYGSGRSERALGAYFSRHGRPRDAVLVTKGCVEARLVRPEYIEQAIAGSLERLATDSIDLYLLHRDDTTVPVDELVDVLDQAVTRGAISGYGGSNWTVERLAQANAYAAASGKRPFVASSPHVALATPREPWWAGCTYATAEDLAWYAAQSMTVLAWSAQGRGFFARDRTGEERYLGELERVYGSEENHEKRRRLLILAAERETNPQDLALAFTLGLPAPLVALVGPLSVADVERLMAVRGVELTMAERAWLALENTTRDGLDPARP